MKHRAETGIVQFFWPNVAKVIEWKLNWHTCNSLESVVAAFVSNAGVSRTGKKNRHSPRRAPLQPFPSNDAYHHNRNRRNPCATFSKPLAMSRIERQFAVARQINYARQHAFGKRAAGVVL